MKDMKRYAIFYAPPEGGFSKAAASWLGWDAACGIAVPQPNVAGLDHAALTAEPRKYGFHGTLKPPFRLARGASPAALSNAVAALAASQAPVMAGALDLRRLGGFLALVPDEPTDGIAALAAKVVETLDPLRAPITDAEIARRRPERLTLRQRALLDRYGYPFVMEEFRFHLTLTGRLEGNFPAITKAAEAWFKPHIGGPFQIADICLFGEDEAGMFHLLARHALMG
ncbi:MAG: DUF1045 domain-containing protein [Albidovulum sp.]